MKEITEELVEKTKEFLGSDGINWFREIKQKHGCIDACWNEGGIPYSVHFNDGMQVRNFMRGTGLCEDWDCHDFDNNWVALVERCLETGQDDN